MKHLLALWLYGFCVCMVYAQDKVYDVLKVEPAGKVLLNGVAVVPKNTLKGSDKLVFSLPDAVVRVFDGENVFLIKKAGIVSQVLEDKVTIQEESSERAILNDVNDLQRLLEEKPFVIIDVFLQEIPTYVYSLEAWKDKPIREFFFITYQYEDVTIIKGLPVGKNNALVIDRRVFEVEGEFINLKQAHNLMLKYAKSKSEDENVAQMEIKMLTKEEIKDEVEAFVVRSKKSGLPKEKIVSRLRGFFKQYYGFIDKEYLELWLKKHIGF